MKDAKLAEWAGKLYDLRAKKKKLEKQISKVQDKVVAEMEAREALGLELGELRLTYGQAERTTYFPDLFRKRLSAAVYKKIITHMVDKKALDKLVLSGEIDLELVAECSETTMGASYVKVTALMDAEENDE